MVHEYNRFMGGVDLCDMMLSLYRVKLKSRKWYFQIFFYALKVAVTNAWLLYRRHEGQRGTPGRRQLKLLDFQSQIAYDLVNVGTKTALVKRGRPTSIRFNTPEPKKRKTSGLLVPSGEARYDQIGHFPMHAENHNRCRRYPTGQTAVMCSKCLIHLCFTKDRNCSTEFHVK